jgi:glycosyltransferase involved in cell wall biosynthesis
MGDGSLTREDRGARPRTVAVLPAYNAAHTLEATVRAIPPGAVDEILLVDDASQDGTAERAAELGLRVVRHDRNRGYGANQKTCYREALARGAERVVMIHADDQYDARVIPHLLGLLDLGICDVMLGSRIRTRGEALAGGMPLYKYLGNRALTILENVVLGQNLGEFHSGLRAYRREVLETVPFERNRDDFVFDSQFLVQAVHFGFRLGDVPVPVRYFPEASSIGLRDGMVYVAGTLGALGAYAAHRSGLRRSALFEPRGGP